MKRDVFSRHLSILTAILLSVTFLTACSDDEPKEDAYPLSNTNWAITSVSGWGIDSSDYLGCELHFGKDGAVTEWYSSNEYYHGTYSANEDQLFLNGLPLTYELGSTFEYALRGNTLTLIADEDEITEINIVLQKK